MLTLGRTPKGLYSPRGRSSHLLETPFSEPLLRTLFNCKTHSRAPFQNPSKNPSPEPFPDPSQNPSENAVLPYDPLGVHPRHRRGMRRALIVENLEKTLAVQFWQVFFPEPRAHFPYKGSLINTLFLQIGVSMSSLFSGTDRISLR